MARRAGHSASVSRQPSMADVAGLAGVSSQTVSRVLAGSDLVKPATRDLVMAAVRKLDYHPNTAARRLATGRTRTIGLVTLESLAYSRGAISAGVELSARAAGYDAAGSGIPSLSAHHVTRAIRRHIARGIEGLVIALPLIDVDPAIAEIMNTVPTVVLDGVQTASCDLVCVDQYAAGAIATQHLLDLGHQTVWYVSGPADWSETVGRTAGWRDTLAAAGREEPPILNGDWSADSGYRCGRLLGRTLDVTAVFVASDETAFGMLRALHEAGRSVPGDISVVSMDDTPLARYASPPLTTIRQPFAEIAERAVSRLVAVLDGEAEAGGHSDLITPELIVRESTGPASTV